MKFAPAVLLLAASITALPQTFVSPRSSVVENIVGSIDAFKALIRELGLDPLHINKESWAYALPVPVIFTGAALVEEVEFNGLSNIAINDIGYDAGSNVLTFDFEIPRIHVSADLVRGEAILFENLLVGEVFGSLDIRNVKFAGSVAYNSASVAQSAEVDLSLGGIQSDITLRIGSYDLSERVNNLINVRIPTALQNFKSEVNELFSIYTVRILNRNNE